MIFGVAGFGEVELAVETRHVRIPPGAQEMQPLVGAPAAGIGGPCGFDAGEGIGMRLGGACRNARLKDPLIERDRVRQLAPHVLQKIGGGDALEREAVEVAAQESVEAFAAHRLLDGAQQQRAFLVRHQRAAVVRIAAGEVDVQDPVRLGQSRHLAHRVRGVRAPLPSPRAPLRRVFSMTRRST